jgi:hypothetical protein
MYENPQTPLNRTEHEPPGATDMPTKSQKPSKPTNNIIEKTL